jgi:hypothetical protein
MQLLAPFALAAALLGTGQAAPAPSKVPPQAAGAPAAAPRKTQPVPFTLFRGKILFEASIAGRPVVAILDSGADYSVLDSGFAKTAGLPQGDARNIAGTTGPIAAHVVTGVALDIPGQFHANAQMLSTDLAPMSKLLGRRVDLILGGDIMRKLALGVDFNRHLFRFGRSGMQPTGLTAIPIQHARNAPIVTVQVEGKPLQLEVDFGFGGDLSISPEAWSRIKPADPQVSYSLSGGLGGATQPTIVTRLAGLSIGPFEEHQPDLTVERQATNLAGQADGLLGTSILERYDVVLDIGGDKLWLRPLASPPARRIDRAGLSLAPDGTALSVTHVSTGSPAAGSWKVGDRICRIDGRAVDPATEAAYSWSNGPEGSIVQLDTCDGAHRTLKLHQYY